MESLTSLLKSPRKWTSAQFRALNLSQSYAVAAVRIVGVEYLPADGDEEFEHLAADLTGPSEQDLADFGLKRSIYRRNPFHLVFVRLYEAAQSRGGSEAFATSHNIPFGEHNSPRSLLYAQEFHLKSILMGYRVLSNAKVPW
ncbi:hypothetical protein BDV38DRAFT_281870 [Aspergillus pseudotamarii]|uniref:Uncharacterized protein n=1 Tax=Aspergillus pseudotamarii TaxID=132259 RepID=A0A5N6SZL2_ASPPS|nr:uncharacterized protein BDV38DRAFT_281870 [Aspergillus pseudotamarii]KAE8138564.1 hypothetical protein BDV38DRAFT_281870 [Aspergillus pseudotamarii]